MNPIKGWLADAGKSPDTRHVDTCDGVRALAICIVAWYHIWQQSWLYPNLTVFGREISFDPLVRSGYIWVDMMILISGFCLYLPWARLGEGEKGQSPAAFYEKRLARVHPSYLLTIAVMLGVALATRAYGDNRSFMLRDVASHLTYTQMFAYDTYYATNLGGSLWTLALEMQLYLIFPLLARAFRRQPAATFAAMMGIALATRGYIAATYPDVSLYFNQLPAYLDTFALGMAAALAHVRLSRVKHGAAMRLVCSAATAAALWLLWRTAKAQAGCATTEAIRLGQMNRRLAMGLLGAALLVASANAGWVVRHILSNPVTRFVSSVSMQFYIWHQTLAVWLLRARIIPSVSATPNYDGELLWQKRYTFVCFAAALLLAALLTYGFERPVSRRLLEKKLLEKTGKKQKRA